MQAWRIAPLATIFSVVLILLVSGCTTQQAPSGGQQTGTESLVTYSEAPMLASMVESGDLPPAEERLSENPMLLQPLDGIGEYGGTYRRGMKPSGDYNSFTRVLPEGLLKYDEKWTKVVPNLAQSFEANEDATVYTFHLREGLKWSDGEPFTADDIIFWWDDMVLNEKVSAGSPPQSWLVVDGKPAVFEKVNTYTVKISFSKPYGLFPLYLASVFGPIVTSYPKHYVKQFHEKYNPDVQELVDEAGVKDWAELLKKKVGNPITIESLERFQNTEMPVLNAWVIKDVYTESASKITCERNPYYWKIDPAGNQLPYFDYLEYVVTSPDEMARLASEGKIDMQIRHIGDEKYRELFEQNMKTGGYKLLETLSTLNNNCVIALNMNHEDAVLREIFQNKDFRIGLSHAIDRQTIIDEAYNGQGVPSQPAPRPESNFYDEGFATQYTEYDVGLANEYLDKAYPDKDSEGYRLGPDGKRISFTIMYTDFHPVWDEVLSRVADYWKVVGVEVTLDMVPRAEYDELRDANDYDATVWMGDGGMEVLLEPRWYFPYSDESLFAQMWQRWYNKNSGGEEPPDYAKAQMALYDRIKSTGDPALQEELMKQIIDISKEQFYAIGISRPGTGLGVIRNDVRNVPMLMPYAWLWPTPYPTNLPLYYRER